MSRASGRGGGCARSESGSKYQSFRTLPRRQRLACFMEASRVSGFMVEDDEGLYDEDGGIFDDVRLVVVVVAAAVIVAVIVGEKKDKIR